MYENHALNYYLPVDQRTVSERAERAAQLRQALREQKLARKAQRKQRRALRHSKEAYTTAV